MDGGARYGSHGIPLPENGMSPFKHGVTASRTAHISCVGDSLYHATSLGDVSQKMAERRMMAGIRRRADQQGVRIRKRA